MSARLVCGILVVSALIPAAVAVTPGMAMPASGCQSWGDQPPHVGSADNALNAVAVVSRCSAWAVGYASDGTHKRTLILHWNGTTWKQQASPNAGSFDNELSGVAATSATNAWAVGYASDGTNKRTLILHWNGTTWKHKASPNAGSFDNELFGVTATSPTNVWAVGEHRNVTNTDRTLAMHWNGTGWKVKGTPNVGTSYNDLFSIDAVSASSVWAVGTYFGFMAAQGTLVLHWNGATWKVQPSPNPGGNQILEAVAATSTTNAWAVGFYKDGSVDRTLVERWNGSSWKQQPSPNVGADENELFGLGASSSTNVWAVGQDGAVPIQALAIHCC